MLVSHAQNFEDVIIRRALMSLDKGFYIDIGASDPVLDSVSHVFYQLGWRGILVEPVAFYADQLRAARPGEIVIQAAIGPSAGLISFFEVKNTGLSTGKEAIAREHEAKGWQVAQTTVPCLPLSTLLDSYADREIHWMKIDVEGMERDVIESWRKKSQDRGNSVRS